MAQIALVTVHLNSSVYQLAQSLSENRHEVIIVTGQDAIVDPKYDFQVLRYFKKWNAYEALHFFSKKIFSLPEIWHFVFNPKDKDISVAQIILSHLVKNVPMRTAIGVSFFTSVQRFGRFRLRALSQGAHFMTTSNRENLMYLKRNFSGAQKIQYDILPPVVGEDFAQITNSEGELSRLIKVIQPFFICPQEPAPSSLIEGVNVLVLGNRPSSESPYYYTQTEISDAELRQILPQSLGLVLALNDFEVMELQKYKILSNQTQTPLMVTREQNEQLPGLCQNKVNGVVVNEKTNLRDVGSYKFKFQTELQELAPKDYYVNRLSRMYNLFLGQGFQEQK